uniref:Uncharacterized protein n=1 Tax=Anguilla anguilla TaxID=7936 RepID=A0A0E9PFG8_ANGAN
MFLKIVLLWEVQIWAVTFFSSKIEFDQSHK